MKTALVSLFVLLFSHCALGFSLNSTSAAGFRGWEQPEIQFELNLGNCPSSVDVRGIVQDALAIWNNVPSSNLKLTLGSDTTAASPSNPIPIYCDPNYGSTNSDIANGSPGAADVRPTSGQVITSGIMYLNASSGRANIANLSRDLVAVTLAHEIGHLIGLGHSQDVSALMYYDASLKSSLALAQDDMDAVAYLYPRDEVGKDKMLGGCGLIGGNHPRPRGPSGLLFLISIFLPFFVYLGLRQRQDLGL